ncbi:MAG: phosphatase PAP2 family protein [Lachnospiraceae bacterium]|nr:phosphatase PAP2 family protein [Lachnospiraceae bacterium]
MSKKRLTGFLLPAVLFIVFVAYTFVVKYVGVEAIGPEGSKVGLAGINGAFFEKFGYNATFHRISELLGYAAIGVALCFAAIGAMELIKGKSIKKVDIRIILLGIFYVLVVAFYALFEVLVINYRPVILDEGLEASYPSSHTMLAVCVLATAVILIRELLNKSGIRTAINILLTVLLVAIVVFRLFSGVHWFTDIIGALLLSASLCSLYHAGIKCAVKY